MAAIAEAEHQRVLGAIDQLIEAAGLEAGRIADLRVVGGRGAAVRARPETPFGVRDRDSRVLLLRPHGERRQEAVSERRAVVGRGGRIARVEHRGEPAARQIERLGRIGRERTEHSSARTMPVIGEPSGLRAAGTVIVMRLLPGMTSGCQPNHTIV